MYIVPPTYCPNTAGKIPGDNVKNMFYNNVDPMFCVEKKELQSISLPWITSAQVAGSDVCLMVTGGAVNPSFFA